MRKSILNQDIKKIYKLSIRSDSICSMLQIKLSFAKKSELNLIQIVGVTFRQDPISGQSMLYKLMYDCCECP